jgi:hypothetical protein
MKVILYCEENCEGFAEHHDNFMWIKIVKILEEVQDTIFHRGDTYRFLYDKWSFNFGDAAVRERSKNTLVNYISTMKMPTYSIKNTTYMEVFRMKDHLMDKYKFLLEGNMEDNKEFIKAVKNATNQ